ncbi:hypothetical protein CFU_2213 [Collimonas fungivorans Ter331]|uniref:Uncharacterized protein n=1 Tax=Collimonas fungivorans (strain Ter331) TaxID=1005048 RepID=G0AKB4_COLFT|nr:hypothetical protein CFU_2213 [Collimonas fungivorans Ter331]
MAGALVFGLRARSADERHDRGQHLDVARLAAEFGGAAFQVVVKALHAGQVGLYAEHYFRPARGEILAALRRSGLDDDRPVLRRGGNIQRTAHIEVSAAVGDRRHPVGVGIAAAACLQQQRVGRPAAPQLMGDVEELVGAVIACIVAQGLAQAEIVSLALVDRSHHVPCCAAGRQVIECGEFARQAVRLAVGGRACRAQSYLAGERCQCAQHRQRIKPGGILVAMADAVAMVAAEAGRDRQPVGEKQQVEFAALQRLRDACVIVEFQESARIAFRVAPQHLAVGGIAGDQESGKMHHGVFSVTIGRQLLQQGLGVNLVFDLYLGLDQVQFVEDFDDLLLFGDDGGVDRHCGVVAALGRQLQHLGIDAQLRRQQGCGFLRMRLGPGVGFFQFGKQDADDVLVAVDETRVGQVEGAVVGQAGAVAQDARAGRDLLAGQVRIPQRRRVYIAGLESRAHVCRVGDVDRNDVVITQAGFFQRPHQQVLHIPAAAEGDFLALQVLDGSDRRILRHENPYAFWIGLFGGQVHGIDAGCVGKGGGRVGGMAEIDGVAVQGLGQLRTGREFEPFDFPPQRLQSLFQVAAAFQDVEGVEFLVTDAQRAFVSCKSRHCGGRCAGSQPLQYQAPLV